LAVLVLSVPYRAAWDAATNPRGETAKRLVSLVGDQYASLPEGATVVVQYGSKGLATVRESQEIWFRAMGGAVFWVFHGGKHFKLRMLDVSKPPPNDLKCPPCLFLDLKPGLALEPAAGEPAGL
jgi:hypothetical protein